MGVRYYPTVRVRIGDVSYDMAEVVLDSLSKLESMREVNKESKYERSERNGDVEVDGYIKLSLEEQEHSVRIFGNYSDGNLKLVYDSSRTEDTSAFREAINVFEETVYPEITKKLSDDAVRMDVATRTV